MDTIFVIGSNSFSGSHFVNFALSKGFHIYGISRSKEADPVFLPYYSNPAHKTHFKFFSFDLNSCLPNLMETIEQVKPHYVINFAAQGMVAESWRNPDHWYQTNVLANVRLHEELRKKPYLKKYLHVSTPEVYGSTSGLIPENRSYNPSTPYAASRAACDLHLWTFLKNYGFPVVFTRAANVFGSGQQLYRIVPKTIMCIKTKTKLSLHGGGHSVRSFIHIKDVCDATLKALVSGTPGDIFHLSTTEQISIRSLVEKICNRLGIPFSDCVDVVDDRPGKDAAYLLDSTKAKESLGWTPKTTLDEGIDETIHWVENNLDRLREMPQDYIHKP
jgi:dTDP-glucose 4,6-dehydratase